MPNKQSIHSEVLQEFAKHAEESTNLALEAVKNIIAWVEYVPEGELTKGEHTAIMKACQRFYTTIAPIARKYID